MFLDGLLWNTTGMKVNASKGNDVVECVTSHFSSFAMVVLDSEASEADKDALKFISYIGSGLSLVGLVLTCLIYIILHKDLQILTTSRHLVHLNLQIALGLTQIVFLAGGSATHDEIACKVVAILLHYVSLASFCWILLEAAMLYLKLISVYGGEFVRMRNFYAFGWGFPLIFVGFSSGLKINAYGSEKWCWLSYKEGFFWVFFAPVVIVTTVTLVVLIAVAHVLFHAAKAQSSNMKYIVSAARGIIILFPTLGLSWAFSVIAFNHEAMIWKYLFVISTSTQGFLIFLIYGICNREIRSAIKRRIEVSPTTLTT
ncbi:adhesion G-protein coupled receptor D1-like [Dendronephthya gigantea]|uniref:adhesion G-protein coupled receptor D1-like n=1 Tax=Dendronephthya gigantea TaxID=151771 RepID=UPI00106AEE51|nr:adhesion G-protein coupled receptor D1-like [Dendronephthya gigantea]